VSTESKPLKYLDPDFVGQISNMELRARLIVEGFITGMHKSPYHGFSVEFAEHRPYNPGDELRHVDWKVYGKTDRHYVKQYEEETNLRHYVVLDTSHSMRYKHAAKLSKLEYGAYLAGALHFMMVRQRDATGLIAFDESIHTLRPPKSTPGYLRQLLSTLVFSNHIGLRHNLYNHMSSHRDSHLPNARTLHNHYNSILHRNTHSSVASQ